MKFRKKGWVFAQTPIWAACDPNISDGAHRLLVYLAWRQGNDNGCWPSRARMARDLNASRETIRRRLRELEDAGYLITARRDADTLFLQLPNERAVAWVNNRLHAKILATVRRVFEEDELSVAYEVRE
jgi:DNA-binding transcriptional MocR family regulator